MNKYTKALTALGTAFVGTGVAFGVFSDAESQAITMLVTSFIAVLGVFLFPNGE